MVLLTVRKNVVPWWAKDETSLAMLKAALTKHAPLLALSVDETGLSARGSYELWQDGEFLDHYAVELAFQVADAQAPPIVWETGGRIPRVLDRHIKTADGSCCVDVDGAWLLEHQDDPFDSFFRGPFRDFFISQTYFEHHRVWPFGERAHGLAGFVARYAEHFGVPDDVSAVRDLFRVLTADRPKGHWPCPCQSDRRFRDCCRERIMSLSARLTPSQARELLTRLEQLAAFEAAGWS